MNLLQDYSRRALETSVDTQFPEKDRVLLRSLKVGSEVVLKNSTYPNKRNIVYATIRSTNPATKAGGIDLGKEFALVRIDEPILDNEKLGRELSGCKTIGDVFSPGFLIDWPSAFVSYFLPFNILESYLSTFNHTTKMSKFLLQMRKKD
ncbi:hypothetical protein QYE76_048187 [Lolium multiflorum]|uniref:Transposase Tnp1/En/Spm-like domain-containing protein n=1 Tax=Lolium multiflorum TaxID=4521 RepID=A0AAD8QKH6_LOLMU|nr:hypothetical protein QYE76_048187 [Lolium multiflorum]